MSHIHSHYADHCVTQYLSSSLLLCALPPELLIHNIIPYLTYLDLCSLSQVNKTFKRLIDTNDQLWTNAIKNEMLSMLQRITINR